MTEYNIFTSCFPFLKLSEDQFSRLLNCDSCKKITAAENGEVAGFAYIYRNCIRLICVKPKFQGKGIGSNLLREAEELVKKAGYKSIIAGGLDSALFIGEVISKEQFNAQGPGFLKKHGYTASHGCVEMQLELDSFSLDRLTVPFPDDTVYKLHSGDNAELLEAAEKIDPDWVEYFRYSEHIYTAEYKGQLAGMCILGFDDLCLVSGEGFKTGNIGCVGVIPEMRKKGIGLSMVANAAALLKEQGCKNAFIHYTHLENWYGKIGAQAVIYCAFSGKKF